MGLTNQDYNDSETRLRASARRREPFELRDFFFVFLLFVKEFHLKEKTCRTPPAAATGTFPSARQLLLSPRLVYGVCVNDFN